MSKPSLGATPDRRFRSRRWRQSVVLAAAILAIVAASALLAPWLAPYPADLQLLEMRLEPPSAEHWLGLDELGRDILSRLLYGARISLRVGFLVVAITATVGTLVGSIAAFRGGWADALLMRICDVFLAFPGILLAIALVAVLGPSLFNLILALAVVGWVGYARLARSQVLSIVERPFIEAARASGLPSWRILIVHVLPQVLPVVIVQASLGVAGAILAEAGLSFLGLGVPPPASSWGAMIQAGRSHLLEAPHVAFFPGMAIVVTVLALNFLGDALADRRTVSSPGSL